MTSPQPPTPGDVREDQAQQAGEQVGTVMAALEASLVALAGPLLTAVLARTLPSIALGKLRRAGQLVVRRRAGEARKVMGVQEKAVQASARETLAGLLPEHHKGSVERLALPRGSQWQSVADSMEKAGLNALRDVEDVFRHAADLATRDKAAGVKAAQKMMNHLADHGLTVFTDRTGRNWSLGSYSEMAVRTAASRLHLQTQLQLMGPAGMDLVYVDGPSAEMGCPKCAPFEGRILSLSGTTRDGSIAAVTDVTGQRRQGLVTASLAEAKAAGFLHPNCRHSLMPFTDGAIIALAGGQRGFVKAGHPYQRGVLPDAESANYRAQQRQRALERRVRQLRTRQSVALTPEAKTQARLDVNAATARLVKHIEDSHLTRQRRREIPGGARS